MIPASFASTEAGSYCSRRKRSVHSVRRGDQAWRTVDEEALEPCVLRVLYMSHPACALGQLLILCLQVLNQLARVRRVVSKADLALQSLQPRDESINRLLGGLRRSVLRT